MADEVMDNLDLENLLSPFCYASETPLPRCNPEVPGGLYISGIISQDCTWGCCFNQSVIQCFPVDKYFDDNVGAPFQSAGSTLAVSSSSFAFRGGRITCATELAIHNQRTTSGARKLLLGISYVSENNNRRNHRGALVIFDPIRCAPMKWIEIPDPVSSVTVLSHFEEGGSNRPFFNETMMAMVGIAAVGLRGGTVIVIDLGLDDPILANTSLSEARNLRNMPYHLLYVNPHEYVIATKRHKAVSKRSLISLKFTNEPVDEIQSGNFHYCMPVNNTVVSKLVIPKTTVAVTCIEYVPAIGSLLVGFTCGGFQIWRVNNMELIFSSEPIQTNIDVPIFGFSFQQPVDDPKNYCYIWVMYGNKTVECSANTFVELYSLLYEHKQYIENFGHIYEEFKQCAKRLYLPLKDDFLSNDGETEDSCFRLNCRPIRMWTQPDSDLMFCAWEVQRGGLFYVGAFDLNQWYSNHTRDCIVYNPITGLCPYWVALPVEVSESSVLDTRIIPKSTMKWENPHAKLDVHLYPASLSFRAVSLTHSGVFAFEHFGIQEKLIRIMLKDGPNLMIEPANIKAPFMRYGLEPVFQLLYDDMLAIKDRDRYSLFTVLLENRRTSAITRLAHVWVDGSYANVGCTIDLIINWIRCYMQAVRSGATEHWKCLFNVTDGSLSPETVRFINFSNFVWTTLHRLLLTLMHPSEVYSARGVELEDLEYALSKLVQYSSALLLLYKAKLLPESNENFLGKLEDYYVQRRAEAKTTLETSPYIDNDCKSSHPLMIDHLMDCLLVDEDLYEVWHVEESQALYPPRHIGYLANMFIWTDVDPRAVARVFMYFLIDLNYAFTQISGESSNSETERKILGNFRAVMGDATDEYQNIMDLWLLDHGFYDDILVHLKEKDRLHDDDGLPWCAATVALTAVGYEMEVAELLQKSCPTNLAKLLFSLMASSSSRYTTLMELMATSNLGSNDELLQEFFKTSDRKDFLTRFIERHAKALSSGIRSGLVRFLTKTDSFRNLSQLLMYYLHLEDYQKLQEEFDRVREILRAKDLSPDETDVWKSQETYINHRLNTASKNSFVENFLQLKGPTTIPQLKCTISLPVAPAKPDDSPPSKVFRTEPNIPPQLRRLKLADSIASDPLSPLRRYAGRLQSSAALPDHDEERPRKSRRFTNRVSRLSFSARRRKTISRDSITYTFNDDFDDLTVDLDQTRNKSELRNSTIDLVSILMPPTIDHRPEINCIPSTSFGSNTNGIPVIDGIPVQSIMKEKDSTKPKVEKKGLRFENEPSSEEDPNDTIYEDADESLHENPNDNADANNVLGASFLSAADSSSEDTNKVNIQEAPGGFQAEGDNVNLEKQTENVVSQSDEIEIQGVPEGIATETKRTSSRSKTPTEELHTDENQEKLEGIDLRTTRASSHSSTPTGELHIEEIQVEFEGTATRTPTKEIHTEEIQEESEGIATRTTRASSRSRTPKKELHTEGIQDELEGTATRTRRASSRSRTPKKELHTEGIQDELEGTATRSTRASSRSRTPTRELHTEEIQVETDGAVTRRTKGSSRSRTPTRELHTEEIHEELESAVTRTTRASSRSRTPTRELHTEEIHEELESAVTRTTRASSRSRTPTGELHTEEIQEESEGIATRTTRTSSRSRTPKKELHTEGIQDELEGTATRTRRASSRSRTPTRELHTEGIQDELEGTATRSTRASSRSRTPTRELHTAEIHDEPEGAVTRTTRASSRSRTPTRELHTEEIHEEPEGAVTRTTRASSRSRTPTRELQTDDVHGGTATRTSRRTSRSRTPTREIKLDDIQEQPEIKVTRTRTRNASRSTTPTRELTSEETCEPPEKKTRSKKTSGCTTVDDEEKPSTSKRSPIKKPVRETNRRLKYFDHEHNLSTFIEDSLLAESSQSSVSVFEQTVVPPKPEPEPTRKRIKGIRQRPTLEEEEEAAAIAESEVEKPSKRRKKVAVEMDDIQDDDDESEVGSSVSLRSNRSTASSKRGSASKKSRGRGRKGKGGK